MLVCIVDCCIMIHIYLEIAMRIHGIYEEQCLTEAPDCFIVVEPQRTASRILAGMQMLHCETMSQYRP